MPQHDYNIAGGSGAVVRADLNDAFEAIATENSGSSYPGTTFAHQRLVNTTLGVNGRRNAANSAVIVEGTEDETRVMARSSNTMLDVSDFGKWVIYTSSFSQSFDTAANLGDGWWIGVRNNGAGFITFDPSGAETINAASVLILAPGESLIIVCNGSTFYTLGRGKVIQTLEVTPYTSYNSTALTIPADDTIPQIGEGDLWITAPSFSPTSTTTRLVIDIDFFAAPATAASVVAALFQDSTANALAVAIGNSGIADHIQHLRIRHEMASGGIAGTVFTLRAGASSGTMYVNGNSTGRKFGGIFSGRMRITEFV